MRIEKDNQGKEKFMFVCPTCGMDWDGWTAQHNKLLIARCKELGVTPPPKNAKGWLPREF